MTLNETAIEYECRQRGLNVVEYPLYRFVQVLYTILSLASLPLLLYVQIKYIFGSTFHRNIKVYAITSSLVSKPCDFFPPTYIYIPLHLLISVSWYGLTLTLMALCCERSVATIRFNKYESNGIALSLFLLTLVSSATIRGYQKTKDGKRKGFYFLDPKRALGSPALAKTRTEELLKFHDHSNMIMSQMIEMTIFTNNARMLAYFL
uniref:G protein-coupled receptor n=1 Tax=Angiostrongylus cantonensis TaxID=6313 RepID=A0A0K0CVB5_ANGCA